MTIEEQLYNIEDSILLNNLKLTSKEKVELLIFLVNYIGVTGEIEDYYLLLGGRDIITNTSFDNKNYMISNARKILKTLNQRKVYLDSLEEYDKDIDNENIYVRKNESYVLKEVLNDDLHDKEKMYYKLLNLKINYKYKEIKYALVDDKRYGIIIDDIPIEIKIINKPKVEKIKIPKKNKKSEVYKIKIDELIEEGKKIDKILSPKGEEYRSNLLKNNTFKIDENGILKETQTIKLKEVTNIIGQVGAGKSTFVDALINDLSNKNKKVLLIVPTVNKILEKCEEQEKLGNIVTPIIGLSMWEEHIEKVIDKRDYLNKYASKILTPGCPLGGLIKESGKEIKYGKEPCNKIYRFDKTGMQLDKSKTYTCPYYYKCPKTSIYKDIAKSDVIITTSQGLAYMNIGAYRVTLFQYILNYIDLVIVDEAEVELNKLDQIFSVIISFDDYIIKNGSILSEYYGKYIEYRASEKENGKFIEYYIESNKAFERIYKLIQKNRQGFNISSLKRPFSAKSLIKICEDKSLLPNKVIHFLNKFIGKNSENWMLSSIFSIETFIDLNGYFKSQKIIDNELKKEEYYIIIFIISVLYFEHNYRQLSNLVYINDNLPITTKTVLSRRFQHHQRYLPVDPRGNIFKLQYKDDGYKTDLCIVKLFALGRSMYLKFPYLNLDSNGKPQGPKVLLLSGSSFAPGSLSNHINEKVDYIIEGEKYKTDFISKSHFEFYDSEVNVSGSKDDKRDYNLKKLIENCKQLIFDKLEEDKKILMIVNSYRDAQVVYKNLSYILKDSKYKKDVSYVQCDYSNESDYSNEKINNTIKYSHINDFGNTDYKILISPAILIERGHNILDYNGNSAFDVLMFLTRPMPNPTDYSDHVCKVNGYIMSKYSSISEVIDLNLFSQMRRDAYKIHQDLENRYYKLSDLPKFYQQDIMVTLFIMILQIFGRLCRIGREENIKSEPIEVYFLDSSFKSQTEKGFDFLNALIDYLDNLLNIDADMEIARALYLPFYTALKEGKNIYGKK